MNSLELKIPPLVLLPLFAGLMWLTNTYIPFGLYLLSNSIALVCFSLGLVIAAAGVLEFHRNKTTVDPRYPEKSSSVVDSGIYRFSRNPMYLGMLLVLTAWACYLQLGLATMLLPLFMVYMNRFQIQPEERILLKLFGQDYRNYQQRVRAWI